MERLVISMDGAQINRLRKAASARGISVAALVRNAVDRMLDNDVDDRLERVEVAVEELKKLSHHHN